MEGRFVSNRPTPTERELEILKILWRKGEGTVREVYEEMRARTPIVQNTVQAFLRNMEEKQLVAHRVEGRTFVYRPLVEQEQTGRRLAGRLLDRLFDGAIDQLVDSLLSFRPPTEEELARLEALVADAKSARRKPGKPIEP
jgi:predicted transcriptional regulator